MTSYPVLAVGLALTLVMVLFVISALLLMLVILIQKGKGGGLTGAIAGGTMGNILGSQAKGPLTYITIGLVTVFLLLAVVMAKYYKPTASETTAGTVQSQQSGQASGQLPAQTEPGGELPPEAVPGSGALPGQGPAVPGQPPELPQSPTADINSLGD